MTITDMKSRPDTAQPRPQAVAKRVYNLEIAGLKELSAATGDSFDAAVDLLYSVQGRAILTGMGKSGHIARKIAATLSSTGTPAHFVHPAEASHGDLGMITTQDAVIALSASGNTAELDSVIGHCARFDIPLIAITQKKDSTLAGNATTVIEIPGAQEACPLGLAPTTSMLLMLALGDAIAVALLERRGFTSSDFRTLHPGGSLGRRLLRVGDLMHSGEELPLVSPTIRMDEALLVITERRFGCAGVIDRNGRLTGMLTDGDLRRHMGPALLASPVGNVMSHHPKTVAPTAAASEALRLMNENRITVIFVVDRSGAPVGILHVHDCLRAGVV